MIKDSSTKVKNCSSYFFVDTSSSSIFVTKLQTAIITTFYLFDYLNGAAFVVQLDRLCLLLLYSILLVLFRNLMTILLMQFVERLTKGILETFQMCNPNFKHLEVLNPKHFFTNPSDGIQNNGHDNANSDLILYTDCVLVNLESKRRFDFPTDDFHFCCFPFSFIPLIVWV